MKKFICAIMAVAVVFTLCACSKQKATVQFTDLKLGVEKQEVVKQLGDNFTEAGTTPDRMLYYNIALFDFIGKNEQTKLTINLNTENKTYAYSYYMYDNIESNYTKVKSYFESLFGPATEGENASETWVDGDRTYYLFKQSDYVAIGVN